MCKCKEGEAFFLTRNEVAICAEGTRLFMAALPDRDTRRELATQMRDRFNGRLRKLDNMAKGRL
jgi:hypothetical protein